VKHFLYQHLPANGMGYRDPHRPFATGGIGFAYTLYKIFMRAVTVQKREDTYSTVEGVEQ